MKEVLFQEFCNIAHRRAGIALKKGKEALVSARVAKRLRVLGLANEEQYVKYLRGDESGQELVRFLDVIATNFTSFFREPDHFHLLSDSVCRLCDMGQQKLRFWSTASSSGEEPYSMAITIAEALGGREVDFKVLATDISTKALAQGREGEYDEAKIASIPKHLRFKYFNTKGRPGTGRTFEVKPELKEHVVFGRLNLADPPYPMRNRMAMVFCRNVMIYLDHRVRQSLIMEIERLLERGGILAIGHSETLMGIKTGLRMLTPSVYQKVG